MLIGCKFRRPCRFRCPTLIVVGRLGAPGNSDENVGARGIPGSKNKKSIDETTLGVMGQGKHRLYMELVAYHTYHLRREVKLYPGKR